MKVIMIVVLLNGVFYQHEKPDGTLSWWPTVDACLKAGMELLETDTAAKSFVCLVRETGTEEQHES